MRIDCHCDTALLLQEQQTLLQLPKAHQDYQRISRYLDAAFMAVFVNEKQHPVDAADFALHLMRRLLADIEHYPHLVIPLTSRSQLAEKQQPALLLLGLEGAAPLGLNSEYLPLFWQLGLRFIGLSWNYANRYAGGAFSQGSISQEGERLIEQCNCQGILLDGAHLNPQSFWQLLEISSQPVIISHTCCAALQPHPRNLDDRQIKALAAAGGVMGITFFADFLGGAGDLPRLLEHIEHAVLLAGSEHVALGSDFDGCDLLPELAGTEHLPSIYQALSKRGMSATDIDNIAGNSVAALLQQVLP